jgi:hypothetical protein
VFIEFESEAHASSARLKNKRVVNFSGHVERNGKYLLIDAVAPIVISDTPSVQVSVMTRQKKVQVRVKGLQNALRRGRSLRARASKQTPMQDLGVFTDGKFRSMTEQELHEKGLDRSFSLEN